MNLVAVAKPILASAVEPEDDTVDACGTALPVGGDLFLTACHVADYPGRNGLELWVGFPSPNDYSQEVRGRRVPSAQARVAQRWPDVDLAALIVRGAGHPPLAWQTREVNAGDDVCAAGYPYALDPKSRELAVRFFKGHVVCARDLIRFPARPACYETSFPAPRGLSGAALLRGETVVGCVIGNESMRMDVFDSGEFLDRDGVVNRVERYEGLNVGLAIQARVILALQLDEGRTLRDCLVESGGKIAE